MPHFDSRIYQRLVEHMNEGVWMGDEQERTVFANSKFCDLIGYTLEEMMGKESYYFWDEESAKKVKEVNVTDRKSGVASSYEGNLRTKTGEIIPVHLSGAPLDNGGTIGIMTDMRPYKRQESLYKQLVENMNEAVWVGDEKERTVYANPKFCELCEYSLNDMMGKESYYFWDEESAEKIRHVNKYERTKGLSSSYEVNLLTKTGTVVPVYLRGSPLPEGGTIGIMTDLRDLKIREEKERIFTRAMAYANDGIIVANTAGNIESWNKGAEAIFGFDAKEILGKNLSKILDENDLKDLLSHVSVQYNLELIAKHKNNQELLIATTVTPVLDERNDTSSFFLLIVRDITAQRKFEEELGLKYQKIRDAYNSFGIVRRQMDYVFDLADLCNQHQDLQTIGDFIVNATMLLSRTDGCILRLYDKRSHKMKLLSSFGVTKQWSGAKVIDFKGSLAEKAFLTRMPLKIIDIAAEPRYTSKKLAKAHNFSSLLLIPLVFQDDYIGTLALYVTPDKRLELFENDFIEDYAKLIAIVLAKAKK